MSGSTIHWYTTGSTIAFTVSSGLASAIAQVFSTELANSFAANTLSIEKVTDPDDDTCAGEG